MGGGARWGRPATPSACRGPSDRVGGLPCQVDRAVERKQAQANSGPRRTSREGDIAHRHRCNDRGAADGRLVQRLRQGVHDLIGCDPRHITQPWANAANLAGTTVMARRRLFVGLQPDANRIGLRALAGQTSPHPACSVGHREHAQASWRQRRNQQHGQQDEAPRRRHAKAGHGQSVSAGSAPPVGANPGQVTQAAAAHARLAKTATCWRPRSAAYA